jgi:hypothetical protein
MSNSATIKQKMAEENAKFKFPDLQVSQAVVVSTDASESDHVFGFIVKVKSRAVDVLCIYPERIMYRLDCWHADDPQCVLRPDVFSEGHRGVFRLAPREKQLEALVEYMNGARADIAGQLGTLTKRIESSEEFNTTLLARIQELEEAASKVAGPKRKTAK